MAIASLLLFCIPLAGFLLGVAAYNKASKALASLEGMRGMERERSKLRTTKVLATIGMVLAVLGFIFGVFLRVAGGK
jgi:hypothetical protein